MTNGAALPDKRLSMLVLRASDMPGGNASCCCAAVVVMPLLLLRLLWLLPMLLLLLLLLLLPPPPLPNATTAGESDACCRPCRSLPSAAFG